MTAGALPRPIIAIVGRPNVGKSTLFNRLIGRRQALVRDVPGVTRDRLYGAVEFERWQATVVDTGGFDPVSDEPLIEAVRDQVLTAVEEADLVLFVVDARDGATGLDQEIAAILRRSNRPVILVASKVEDDRQSAGLTLVEWPERLTDALPAGRLDVVIDGSGDEAREILLRTLDLRYQRYLEAAA